MQRLSETTGRKPLQDADRVRDRRPQACYQFVPARGFESQPAYNAATDSDFGFYINSPAPLQGRL